MRVVIGTTRENGVCGEANVSSSQLMHQLQFQIHYLPDKMLRHICVLGYGLDCLSGIVVNHGLDFTNTFGRSCLNEQREFLSCFTFLIAIRLIPLFS